MRIRGCPAAVNGNERRHEALTRESWEATVSRFDTHVSIARKPEDLPARCQPTWTSEGGRRMTPLSGIHPFLILTRVQVLAEGPGAAYVCDDRTDRALL